MGLPPPKTQRLVYDLQHLFFKTMTLEARIGPSERVFSGWTLGCNKNPCKPPTFNYRELSPSCSKLCSPLSQLSHTCLKDNLWKLPPRARMVSPSSSKHAHSSCQHARHVRLHQHDPLTLPKTQPIVQNETLSKAGTFSTGDPTLRQWSSRIAIGKGLSRSLEI